MGTKPFPDSSRSVASLARSPRLWWNAVVNRNSRWDGVFVFAVKSTGIYCRPSCPSRRPRRNQVNFFQSPQDAEAAGFRPCKRCCPDGKPNGRSTPEIIQQICASIESHDSESLKLTDLAREFRMSPYHLQRTFKRWTGISPRQYAMAQRWHQFKSRVRRQPSVTDALYESGYGSSSRLYEKSNLHLGMTPRTYQRGGKGMLIHYTISNSPLGRLLVAMTERGVCFVSMGDHDTPLRRALHSEYPAAQIQKGGTHLNRTVATLLRHLRGAVPQLNLPVDVRATAFQWQVWKKLQSIPYGGTQTYSQVARAIGRPTAVRAVARACATNPVSIIVPCHRVIRASGSLAGYRWGLKRKKRLLEIEGRASKA